MAQVLLPSAPVHVEYLPSSKYETKQPPKEDPFRHCSLANSHNHHELHPWGSEIKARSKEFDALYAEANNRYMYHLWYTQALAPYMATKLVAISPLPKQLTDILAAVVRQTLALGVDAAIQSDNGQHLVQEIRNVLEGTSLTPKDRIFVRLGATSTKDSFAIDVPTTKPSPMAPEPEMILRRILTSGRCVGRLLALADGIWPTDPGEALIIQEWSPTVELQREFRVFCFEGRVTAVSQDIWWEKFGWRERYSAGFVDAIMNLWESVKIHLPFDTCTMDVLMSESQSASPGWKAELIEFNGFGAHLNTGSDLFHWVDDENILLGRAPGVTVRFVDDWEAGENKSIKEAVKGHALGPDNAIEQVLPDWLALEEKLRANFNTVKLNGDEEHLVPKEKYPLPLRGRWCSAY